MKFPGYNTLLLIALYLIIANVTAETISYILRK